MGPELARFAAARPRGHGVSKASGGAPPDPDTARRAACRAKPGIAALQRRFTRTLKHALADALDTWKGSGEPFTPPPPPLLPKEPPPTIAKELLTRDAASGTAQVHFGCLLPPVHTRRDELVNALLAGVVDDDLVQHRRLKEDASIKLNGTYSRGGAATLDAHSEVAPEDLAKVLEVLHSWLDSSGSASVTQERLERSRWTVARRSAVRNASNAGLARILFDNWNTGWPVTALSDFPRDLASIDLAQVSAALVACRANSVISVVAP
ncbi:MAG: insulinase family protein [Polyangiaceae bacterium]